MAYLVLLTAARGAGKTTACQRFLELARDDGMQVGGILAPSRYDDRGQKASIEVVDASTGERRTLAVVEPDAARRTVGRYRFDPEVMEWALARVMHALNMPIDVVIIDEIGPLELIQKSGFAPAIAAISSAQARSVILVVRPELVSRLQERLQDSAPATVALTEGNRDEIPSYLLREIRSRIAKPAE